MKARSKEGALARAEKRLKQLCSLNVSGSVVVPTLFRELHELVGFGCGTVWGVDDRGEVTAYFESPEPLPLFPLFKEAFYQRDELRLWHPVTEMFLHEQGPTHITQALKVGKRDYLKSDIYNLFVRPAGLGDFIRLQLRDNGCWLGMLGVYRRPGDPDFDDDDLRLLGRLEPFLTHALMPRIAPDVEHTVSDETGMIVAEPSGRARWMSPSARSLMQMAQGTEQTTLPGGLLRAINELVLIENGDRRARPPAWQCRNAFGTFCFNAYWLRPEEAGDSLIGISITRKIPAALRLFEALGRFSLPQRQADVGLQLALGQTQEQIAQKLGLSRNTVIYHRRQLYNLLSVDTREEFVSRLNSQQL